MNGVIERLAAALRAAVAGTFPLADDAVAGATVMVFNEIGLPVPRLADATGPLRAERASDLVDQVMAPGTTFVPSGASFAARYHELVRSASPAAGLPDDQVALVAGRIAAARRVADECEIVRIGVPVRYLLTAQEPADWFDDSSSAWTHVAIDESDPEPAGGTGGAGGAGGAGESAPPVLEVPPWRFRVQRLDAERVFVPDPVIGGVRRFEVAATDAPTEAVASVASVGSVASVASVASVGSVARPALLASSLALAPSVARTSVLTEVAATHVADAVLDLPVERLTAKDAFLATLDPSVIGAVVAQSDPKPVTGSGFHLELDSLVVTLKRPWLNLDLLATAGWRVPGEAVGSYASGSLDAPGQLLPAIPVAAVVVRDVRISAHWSDDDRSSFASATCLGPFALASTSVESDTLTIDGMQVIAWVCTIPKPLPPSA